MENQGYTVIYEEQDVQIYAHAGCLPISMMCVQAAGEVPQQLEEPCCSIMRIRVWIPALPPMSDNNSTTKGLNAFFRTLGALAHMCIHSQRHAHIQIHKSF